MAATSVRGPTSRGVKPQRATVAVDLKSSSSTPSEKAKRSGGGGGRSEEEDNKRSEGRKAVLVERTVINEKLVRDAIMEDLASQHDPNFMKVPALLCCIVAMPVVSDRCFLSNQ
jgi:hypothetical protein